MTKYDFDFTQETIEKNIMRLTNQIWKLIPMKEHNENWKKQLDTVIIEIAGLNEILIKYPQFIQILSKLEGLRVVESIDFSIFRKTVFEVINLLQEVKNEK